jgi:hypothetical protein
VTFTPFTIFCEGNLMIITDTEAIENQRRYRPTWKRARAFTPSRWAISPAGCSPKLTKPYYQYHPPCRAAGKTPHPFRRPSPVAPWRRPPRGACSRASAGSPSPARACSSSLPGSCPRSPSSPTQMTATPARARAAAGAGSSRLVLGSWARPRSAPA